MVTLHILIVRFYIQRHKLPYIISWKNPADAHIETSAYGEAFVVTEGTSFAFIVIGGTLCEFGWLGR